MLSRLTYRGKPAFRYRDRRKNSTVKVPGMGGGAAALTLRMFYMLGNCLGDQTLSQFIPMPIMFKIGFQGIANFFKIRPRVHHREMLLLQQVQKVIMNSIFNFTVVSNPQEA
jgi:hypothetical protein